MTDEIKELRRELERYRNLAAEAEKWKGIATAKYGDGRTVNQIAEDTARAVREAEQRTIERCAEVCLAQRNMRVERHPPRFEITVDTANIMAEKCAAAIRALKVKP